MSYSLEQRIKRLETVDGKNEDVGERFHRHLHRLFAEDLTGEELEQEAASFEAYLEKLRTKGSETS